MTRDDLHKVLVQILGSDNVYYHPPVNLKISYPAIVYEKTQYWQAYADNLGYARIPQYRATVISRLPDHPAIERILDLRGSDYVSHFVSEGLHHDIIDIFQ